MAYFFRDPDRRVPADPTAVVSPADGGVMVAGLASRASRRRDLAAGQHLPVAGRRPHQPDALSAAASRASTISRGSSCPPTRRSRARSTSAPRSGSSATAAPVVFRQLVGVLARRIVCRVAGRGRRRDRRALRADEVRLADGRVRADLRRGIDRSRSARRCVAASRSSPRSADGWVRRRTRRRSWTGDSC